MKLSKLILEQYKDCESMLMILNKGLATETRDVHLKVTRNLIIERERDASIITQAYKDALYMEEQIEKEKPVDIDGLEKEWNEARGESFVIVNNPCSKCGRELSRNNEMVLLSDPPQYHYNCIECGITEYKFH
tara:strand:+ start:31 stop:429 length:399 start_codon:yes stop_codon:yes gene_type:complete